MAKTQKLRAVVNIPAELTGTLEGGRIERGKTFEASGDEAKRLVDLKYAEVVQETGGATKKEVGAAGATDGATTDDPGEASGRASVELKTGDPTPAPTSTQSAEEAKGKATGTKSSTKTSGGKKK